MYIFPETFERVGVALLEDVYTGDANLRTETEYQIAGTRTVWKANPPNDGWSREHRTTMPIRDLLGTASAVVDLNSGELLEMATFHPNGGREMHWMNSESSVAPERLAFTGKEEDEEVGISYFGQRYLLTRLARWSSPDPLSIHVVAGGEPINSYQYVGGNLLQARDPDGLTIAYARFSESTETVLTPQGEFFKFEAHLTGNDSTADEQNRARLVDGYREDIARYYEARWDRFSAAHEKELRAQGLSGRALRRGLDTIHEEYNAQSRLEQESIRGWRRSEDGVYTLDVEYDSSRGGSHIIRDLNEQANDSTTAQYAGITDRNFAILRGANGLSLTGGFLVQSNAVELHIRNTQMLIIRDRSQDGTPLGSTLAHESQAHITCGLSHSDRSQCYAHPSDGGDPNSPGNRSAQATEDRWNRHGETYSDMHNPAYSPSEEQEWRPNVARPNGGN